MKKLFLLFAGVFCAQAVFAASTTTKNTMKMVAYFPVPYVAYDTVSASQAMDVGVLKKCEMSLGENQSNLGYSNCSLYLYGAADGTDDARRGLLNVSAGKLNLNATGFPITPIIRSSKVLVGSGGTAGYGLLEIGKPENKDPDFNALYISSLAKSGNSVRATGRGNSVADMAAKVTEFKMFDEIANNFPSCGGTVTWQELELGGDVANNKTYKDVYLVCGAAVDTCEPPAGESDSAPCDPPATGTKTRTWNYETCQWNAWSMFGCKLEPRPEEKTYYWELTAANLLGTIKPPYGERATCVIYATKSSAEVFVSGGALKSELSSGVIGAPAPCSDSNLGVSCKVGIVEVMSTSTGRNSYYNPKYTCSVK